MKALYRSLRVSHLLCLLFLAAPIQVYAAEAQLTAQLVRPENKGPPSAENPSLLQFTKSDLEVFEAIENGAKVFRVEIEGKFSPPGNDPENWSLVAGQKILRPGPDGAFKGKIPLTGKVTPVNFLSVGPRGEVIREDAGIVFNDFDRMGVASDLGTVADGSKLHITAGLGISALSYTESARGNISQTALMVKLSADNPVSTSRWSLGGNFYSTLSTISKSTPSSVQVLGVNLRVGYLVPWLKTPWMFRVYAGVYYTTTYGGTGDFGYSNLTGPQIFPTLSYRFQNDAILSGYLKYSPVSSGLKFYALENSETAVGLSYFFQPFKSRFLKGTSAGITADFSWLKLKTDALGTVTFQTDSFGLALRF